MKAQNKRTLTLLEERETTRPPCLGHKPREMKTQKGTNTNLHGNFIHSNQKWKTVQVSTTGKHFVVCPCNRYCLAKQPKETIAAEGMEKSLKYHMAEGSQAMHARRAHLPETLQSPDQRLLWGGELWRSKLTAKGQVVLKGL